MSAVGAGIAFALIYTSALAAMIWIDQPRCWINHRRRTVTDDEDLMRLVDEYGAEE